MRNRIGRGALDQHLGVGLDDQLGQEALRRGILETALVGIRSKWEVFTRNRSSYDERVQDLSIAMPTPASPPNVLSSQTCVPVEFNRKRNAPLLGAVE